MSPELKQLIKDAASFFQERIRMQHADYERQIDWYMRHFDPPRHEHASMAYRTAKGYLINNRSDYMYYWICMCELLQIPLDIDTEGLNIVKVIKYYCWLKENEE